MEVDLPDFESDARLHDAEHAEPRRPRMSDARRLGLLLLPLMHVIRIASQRATPCWSLLMALVGWAFSKGKMTRHARLCCALRQQCDSHRIMQYFAWRAERVRAELHATAGLAFIIVWLDNCSEVLSEAKQRADRLSADRHRHGVVSGHVVCRDESTLVPPAPPLPEFPTFPAGTPLSEGEAKFVCLSKPASADALESYYLATTTEVCEGAPLCSHPGRKLSRAACALDWKPIKCMADLMACAAVILSISCALLPLSLCTEQLHLDYVLRQYMYQRIVLAAGQGALRGRRKPPKLPMLFPRMVAAPSVGDGGARRVLSPEPVRGCAAHSRWLNPFLWVGKRWRRVVRRFYPFFQGNEVESAGNTFAHLEAEKYSGGRRTLHVCDVATDTVLTCVLVNLQAQLAAKVGSVEEAETLIDASRRLLRRDCIGGGLHTVMHLILIVLTSSWGPLGVGAIKVWLKRTDMRPDREAQQVKRKLEFIVVLVTAWLINALDNFADSSFYDQLRFWPAGGGFDQTAFMDAFDAFVDANRHDSECLKHATIITKVAIPLLLYVSAQHWVPCLCDRMEDMSVPSPLGSCRIPCSHPAVLAVGMSSSRRTLRRSMCLTSISCRSSRCTRSLSMCERRCASSAVGKCGVRSSTTSP